MPVGTGFENSAMKASFSLSSLPATECTPEREKAVKPRLYNSLTKNRVKATAVRRSWGSTASDHREEFWSALQANYNYIMDNQLIDKCQEANGDLSSETTIGTWSLQEFYTQFSDLYSWLNSVQETIYGKEENITDRALRARCTEMVNEKSSSLKLFNDQASQVVQLYPKMLEEVEWRVTHLNSKWDTILTILGISECGNCDQETCLDIDHEIKCLKKWFKTMEAALQPLDLRAKYTKTEIETKALELKVLHQDIENHSKIVGSVVKLCRRSDANCSTINVRRNANGLERRWQMLYLRSLEWQCYLESLSKKGNLRNRSSSSSESDDSDYYEGPVNKYPRLSGKDHRSSDNLNAESPDNDSSDWEQKDTSPQPMISDNGMNTNAQTSLVGKTSDTVDGNLAPFGEDTSLFTKSNRIGPNLGTYYFKHEDTDSDMDKIDQNNHISVLEEDIVDLADTLEETSEEEWTYTKNTSDQRNEQHSHDSQEADVVMKVKPLPEDKLKRLVQKVEELVSPEKCRKNDRVNSLNKMTRVKKWLSLDKPDDSCDASGEDDEKESVTSEEFDDSTTTFKATQECHSQNTSFTELNTTDSTPKVLMRQKKYTANRPWSVSCISQLGQLGHREGTAMEREQATNFSISESALHKMNLNVKSLERYDSSTNSVGVNGNNSTSSTMEETAVQMEEKTSPNRRRRLKLKKKSSLVFPSRCCATAANAKNRNLLFKSGSFSGSSNAVICSERHTASDPPSVNIFQPGKYETSTTSGPDSDEELNRRISFKLGLKTHYLDSEMRDISPGKSSSMTTEEQLSSLSEQAWDSYQEKYLSEAYSETHDSDAARKLLEFGEDYRNFIDSQSDWSSTNPDFSPTFRRKTILAYNKTVDSDSDAEPLRQLFKNSRDQLQYTQDIYKKTLTLGLEKYVVANGVSEMISTCDRHIDLLNHIGSSSDDFAMSKADKDAAAELLTRWQQLKADVLKMQDFRDLQKEILLMKDKLVSIETPKVDDLIDISSVNDLGKEVDYCEKTLEYLKEYKSKLLTLNVSVHRFVFENKEYNVCSLKGDISDLYRIWDEVHSNMSSRLSQLRPLLQRWKMLENRIEQLQDDLRSDEKTLLLLDTALKDGVVTDQTATYVRDVAKLLSETSTTSQGCSIPELFTEGSFSDSGISDEGSEHELGERERRLAAIRRLVRQFEGVLAPDSTARVKMAERLSAAEEELKELQRRCRSLIVRTEVCVVPSQPNGSLDVTDGLDAKATRDGAPEDPGSAPSTNSWFRRVVRASLPFQVVIITLLCLACLLEPQCCDNMNNFAMSFSPQLRYVKGRPPI